MKRTIMYISIYDALNSPWWKPYWRGWRPGQWPWNR